MRTAVFYLSLTLLLVLLSGCGKKPKAHVPAAPSQGRPEEGIASWYGYPYHGRQAANGEIYDMEKLTAAHRTLPFGTWVRVENLTNGKFVTVRITDRGPFIDGRIIDLSRAAAREIELLGPGTAKVRLVITSRPPNVPVESFYSVQVGAYQQIARANQVRDDIRKQYGAATVSRRDGNPVLYRVLVGGKRPLEDANALAEQLRGEFGSAMVVRVDTDGF